MKIGFGGGCHWCTEAVFQALNGVVHVDQGWIASDGDQTDFSEAVIVTFNPKEISLKVLIEVHTLTHSSTVNHSMWKKYRSAIYVYDETQKVKSKQVLKQLEKENNQKYIVQVLNFVSFKRNKDSFLNYYQTRPEAAFCQTYITPKLKMLKEKYNRSVNF